MSETVADKSPGSRLRYRGRFAPSPTGPLHFGSLACAVCSYCEAHSQEGQWLVRMEDLDKAREQAGAADDILRTLEAFNLHWDESVTWQSRRTDLYAGALATLTDTGMTYPCACSRADIRQRMSETGSQVYPGTCRQALPSGKQARSIRLCTEPGRIRFDDELLGPQVQDVYQETGDFVLKRADSFFAYQLAVVVDDADQDITHVVRGADLLDNTGRQLYLQQLLNFRQPVYLHLPVVTNTAGEKLSKQTFAKPVDIAEPAPALFSALQLLGQNPPHQLSKESVTDILDWAVQHWQTVNIPKHSLQCLPQYL